eukprot:Phypoly_transcript_00026.p1 GENE.Phypoly_transcript_00026~~Phypoly_transcript_00026.p1  ORF type:complete len:3127 (+),score=429.16 Phypoly_transcript_00026:113-9493(+)
MSLKVLGKAKGQKSDLVLRIIGIIEQYAKGTPVLKELLQNSDDAGARYVVVCLDKRRHSAANEDPGLAKYVGPGILFFNDENFTEADWDAILSIGKSSKKEDTLKTGNFGIGFCSVFNVTDLPSIISGTRLQLLDPQVTLEFVKNQPSEPGAEVTFGTPEASQGNLFDPYRKFCGFDPSESFNGTIIRLPLRETPSRLSQNTYTVESVQAEFQQFIQEAAEMLLFLRCLKHITVMEWNVDASTPTFLYECGVVEEIPLHGSSAKLYEQLKEWRWNDKRNRRVHIYDVKKTIQCRSVNGDVHEQQWLVCTTLFPPNHVPEEKRPQDKTISMKLIPLTGIAARMELPNPATETFGKVFCSLPLPIATQLPVHINAKFAITHDRTGISKDNGMRAAWNEALLSTLLPETYLRLLSSVPGENVLPLLPVNCSTDFTAVLRSLYRSLAYTDEKIAPITNSGATKYEPLHSVLILGSDETSKQLAEILGKFKIPACVVPDRVLDLLQEHCPSLQFATPPRVRGYFRAYQFYVEDGLFVLKNYSTDITRATVNCLHDIYLLPTATPLHFSETKNHPKKQGASEVSPDLLAKFGPASYSQYYVCEDRPLYEILCHFEEIARCLVSSKFPSELLKCILHSGQNINVKRISSSIVAGLVGDILPSTEDDDIVTVEPELHDWISRLWSEYLSHLPKLEDFEDLTLLLTPTPGVACKIMQNSRFFFRTTDKESMTPEMAEILHQLGCQEIVSDQNSSIVSSYVRRPNANEILLALQSALNGEDIHKKFSALSDARKSQLLDFLSATNVKNLTPDLVEFLKKFPIFRNHASNFTEMARYIAPSAQEVSPDLLCGLSDLLDIPAESLPFARALGAEKISTLKFYRRFVFKRLPALDASVRNSAMIRLLRKLPEIPSADFKNELRNLQFVPTSAGVLCSPSELYDPQESQFKGLLVDSNFPCSPFIGDDILVYLRQLGLQTVLSAASLGTLANNIKSTEQAKAFLAYVNKYHGTIVPNKKLVDLLCRCAWMPILGKSSLRYPDFPFREATATLQPPSQTRSCENESLLSCKYFLLDGHLDLALIDAFGWAVSIDDVIEQLLSLTRIDLSSKTINSKTVGEIAGYVYSHLNTHIQEIGLKALGQLQKTEFVFIQKSREFVSAQQLAFSFPFPGVQPYLFAVPKHYVKFKELWHKLKVPKEVADGQLVDLIAKIRKTEPIDERTMSLVVEVLEHLAKQSNIAGEIKERLLVPTTGNTLAPPTKCVFDLDSGLPVYMKKAGYLELNHKISIHAAKQLGVRSLGTAAMECKRIGNNMRTFGQHVGLINTINKITSDYSEASVLGEVIQNADDAKATEIHFIHDLRQHKTDKLFGPTMKELQGESLLVYNNKTFSDADFENIADIASASKANDAKKTGRFGIGFVSSHHLTDTPSFISRDQFCMFDPLREYVPDATPEDPGIRCTLDPAFVADFEDQFAPFEVCGCTPGKSFDGTIFRFPLRKRLSRLKSTEISDVGKLLRALKTGSLLLFLKNIKKITVSRYRCTNGKLEKEVLFEISKEVRFISGTSKRLVDTITPNLSTVLENTATPIYAQTTTEETITFTDNESKTTSQKWLACSTISANKELVRFMKKGKRVPWGGVAVPIGQHGLAQAFCFLPLNVKVPFTVSVNGYFDVPSNRQSIIGHQTSTSNDDSGKWNELLIQHAIAPSYISLLQVAASLLERKEVTMDWYIALFPAVFEDGGFWTLLAESVFSGIGTLKLIPVDPEKNMVEKGSPVTECTKALYVVSIPEDVKDLVEKSGLYAFSKLPFTVSTKIPNLKLFGATMLCDILKRFVSQGEDQINYGAKGMNGNQTVLNNEAEVLSLLSYCVSAFKKDISALKGLPLLPLASMTIGVVGKALHFISPHSALFPTRKDLFLSQKAVQDITIIALSYDQQNLLQLQVPTCAHFEQLLHYSLPKSWKGAAHINWNRTSPAPEWIDTMWKFMALHKDYTTFQNWPLIPTNKGLVQIKKGKSVLYLNECPKILHALLERAGCHIFTPVGVNFNLDLLSPPKPSGLCRALAEVNPGILHHHFTVEEADALRSCLETVSEDHLPVVKSLRIFPDNQGNLVAIHGREWKAIGVKSQIELVNESFLVQSDQACKNLYKLCDIPILTEGKLHNHILSNWDSLCAHLSSEKQFECLDIIRTTCTKKAKPATKTIELLREISFVVTDSGNGQKKKAAELYDLSVELFSASFDPGEGRFPGGQYASVDWLQFLYKLGLIGDPKSAPVSAIEQCAESICQKIQQHFKKFDQDDETNIAVEQRNKLKSRAKVLMKHMDAEKLKSTKLWNLPYAVVDQEATDLPNYCGATIHFTSFANASRKADVGLVWLLRPVLVEDTKFYNILKKPSVSQVVDNLLEFCTNPIDWTHDALRKDRLVRVCTHIYDMLKKVYESSPNHEVWARMRYEKWILVSSDNQPEFASPAEIFCEIPNSFPGYFYKMPLESTFKSFLKHLGMRDSPSYTQICEALEAKRLELNGVPLEPNDFTTIKKLLKFLYKVPLLEHENKRTIYAPDTQRVLKDISQLVLNDTPAIFKNINNEVAKIDFICDLKLVVAIKLGAKSLAALVKVAPDSEQLGRKTIHPEYTQKVNSEDFVNSVLRIVTFEHSTDPMKDRFIKKAKSLRSVKIMECETIVYQYIYNEVNIAKTDSQISQISGVDVQLQEVYLCKGYDPTKVAVELTERLNEIMEHAVKKESMITKLIQAELSEITSVCDGFRIPVVAVEKTMNPGDALTQHDQLRLCENPLYTFKAKEYIAWRDGPIHRYGRIRNVIEKNHSIDLRSVLGTRYEVEVGAHGEIKEMGVIDMFKFAKKQEDHEMTENEEEEESILRMQQLLADKPDEYFGQTSPEKREIIAERIYKATIDDERFKKSLGVVETFVTYQLQHYTPAARTKKLRLGRSNDNNNNNNNSTNNKSKNKRNNKSRSEEEELAAAYQREVILQWKQEQDYKSSLVRKEASAENVDIQYAQRATTQMQNDKETLLFLSGANSTGNMSDTVCFLAHQLLEKSLKAAIACVPHSATIMHQHHLTLHLAACEAAIRENPDIISAVGALEDFYLPTRYLEHHDFPMVTRDAFTKPEADNAVEHAVTAAWIILSYVQHKLAL